MKGNFRGKVTPRQTDRGTRLAVVMGPAWAAVASVGAMACGGNLHTTPWIETPARGVAVGALGYGQGQLPLPTKDPAPAKDALFRKRNAEYHAVNVSLAVRPALSRRVELGLSLSPVALDLKVVAVEAPVTVALIPRWTLINVTEGMNLELPALIGWRGEHLGVFGGGGPRWMVPSSLIYPSYNQSFQRQSSELGGRLAGGVSREVRPGESVLLEVTHLFAFTDGANRRHTELSLGYLGRW